MLNIKKKLQVLVPQDERAVSHELLLFPAGSAIAICKTSKNPALRKEHRLNNENHDLIISKKF